MADFKAGTLWVEVVPSLKGFGKKIQTQTVTAATSEGNRTGNLFSRAFSSAVNKGGKEVQTSLSQVVTKSLPALRVEAEEAQRKYEKTAASVTRNAAKVEAARKREENAAKLVESMERRLAKARESGNADTVLNAERELRSAREQFTSATLEADAASGKYVKALEREARTLELVKGKQEAVAAAQPKPSALASFKDKITANPVGAKVAAVGSSVSQAVAPVAAKVTANPVVGQAASMASAVAPVVSKAAGAVAPVASSMFSGMVTGAKRAAGAVVPIIGGAAAAVGGVLSTALSKGWNRALDIQDAKASLAGLGHSAESVAAIMDDAKASVTGTAFGMGEAASVAASSVAAGIKPGEDLQRTLKLVADAATIAGTDMGSMGSIFNKVASSGKLQGEVIAQLQDRGIPILQLVADQMGVTAEEAADMASRGEISFDTFRDAMENGMGGAALKAGDTIRGAFKNVGAALGRMGETIITPFLPLIQRIADGAKTLIDQVAQKVGPVFQKISDALSNVSDSAGGFTDKLGGIFVAIGTALGPVTSIISNFLGRIPLIGNLLSKMLPGISGPLGIVIGVVSAMITHSKKLRDALWGAFEKIRDAVSGLLPSFEGAGGIFEKVGTIAGYLGDMLAPIVTIIGDLAAKIINVLGAAIQWLLPIISNVLSWIINSLIPTVISIGQTIIDVWQTYIQPALAAVWDFITVTLAPVWNFLAGVVVGAWNMISTCISIVWAALQITFAAIGYVVSSVLGPVFTFFYENVIKPVWDGIKGAISASWDWVKANIFDRMKPIIDAVGRAFTAFKDTVAAAFDAIKAAAAKPINFVINTVYNDGIKAGFDTIAEKVGISTRMPKIAPIGGYASGGVLPGYTPGRDVHRFYSPTAGILDLSGGEGIIRPDALRRMGGKPWLDQINKSRGRGFSPRGDLGRGYEAFADGGIWGSIKAVGSAAWKGITEAADFVADAISDPLATIAKLVTGPADALLSSITDTFWGKLAAGIPKMLWDGIGNLFKRATESVGSAGLVAQARKYIGIPYVFGGSSVPPGLDCSGLVYYSLKSMGKNVPRLTAAGYQGASAPVAWDKKAPGDLLFWGNPANHVAIYSGGNRMVEAPQPGMSIRETAIWGAPTVGRYKYDSGGYLQPGLTQVLNATRRPEPVFTGAQWDTLKQSTATVQPVLPDRLELVLDDGTKFAAYIRNAADERIIEAQRILRSKR